MTKDEVTVIYYTSNREDPVFEQKIKDNILKGIGELPLISVSQKPIPTFGNNLCVGDEGTSGFNMFRQVQIALQAVTTPYVISTEADCLYPPDYFIDFDPILGDHTCYRNRNLYVMGYKRDFFYKKGGATHAQVIGTAYYLNRLNHLFKDAPKWSIEEKNFPRERHHKLDIFDPKEITYYESDNPVIQFKTGRSMRRHTSSGTTEYYTLPYWGSGVELRKKYL